ncbi:MAG: aspartate--tRNA ligase [Thermomicrobiaceae bacterium]
MQETAPRVQRSYTTCGELNAGNIGDEITLKGWVNRRRDHGGLIFLDVRDRYGITQVVANPENSPEAHKIAEGIRGEYVIAVTGEVNRRPEGTENANMTTGEIEVVVSSIEILNPSKTPPFYVNEESDVDESLRLRYRYLDLRHPRMQRNLKLRHHAIKVIRDYLDARDFLEIETPIMVKSTPEGARDYVVPSRLYPGEVYALPQSPQQLKQLLMVSGVDRYYQIARCFRDEDLRADRQPEFTQLDLEMSFVDREDVLELTEGLYLEMFGKLASKPIKETPFPRLSYHESLRRFGTDKPDLRYGLEIQDVSDLVRGSEFGVFSKTVESGGVVRGFAVAGKGALPRSQVDALTEAAQGFGAKGLVWIALESGDEGLTARSPIAKFLTSEEIHGLAEATGAAAGDLMLFVADKEESAAEVLGRLRSHVAHQYDLIDESVHAFCWILDFPLFEWDEDANRWDAAHHPFTSPMDEDVPYLDSDPSQVRAKSYDIALDGFELGSGSIRIHDRSIQNRMFGLLGYNDEQVEARFGHLLRAFEYGAPPHGGIAPGIDRTVMLLAGEQNIREVIAFPKNQSGQDLLMGAPSPIEDAQLNELHLQLELPPEDDQDH